MTDQTIRFEACGDRIEFGRAERICFACGDVATDRCELVFENPTMPTLAGHLLSLNQRRIIFVPVCDQCVNLRAKLRKKILYWGVASIASVIAGFAIATLFDPKLKSGYSIMAVIGVALYPMSKLTDCWKLKDQGGGFVELAESDSSSITLRFFNSNAYAQIANTR